MKIEPFKIDVSQELLDDLQERLKDTRWPQAYENSGWEYGADIRFMKELTDHWLHKYDWRKAEADLNKFNHFKAEVDGLNVHFIHEKGKGPHPTPIILTHGWPDSFYRFHKVIPLLTDPEAYGGSPEESFDVIVPSIPGFGFSDCKAMGEEAVADLWAKLMKGLGYETFAAGGGDVGAIVTKWLGFKYPDAVSAVHLTDVSYPDFMNIPDDLSEDEQEFTGFIRKWWFQEGAYAMIQSTKPQTLSFGLNDSPAGWAAWTTTLLGGGEPFGTRIDPDEQLTNIMIYWVTETIASSVRSYAKGAVMPLDNRVEAPAAVLHCTQDAPLPPEWARRSVNLKQYSELDCGHFAAWEKPEAFVKDIRQFFRLLKN